MTNSHPVHPLGSKAKVLLSSVFGPYAQDDEYGSSTINPMELYHNELSALRAGFYASAYSIVSWLQLGQPRIGIKPTQ